MTTKFFWIAGAIAALASASSPAKVTQQEADRLGKDLTPVGAEMAGNKEGTIPKWEGGYKQQPPCYKGRGTRVCNPFPDDKPIFAITAANVQQYQDHLSAGQLAMFKQYPDYKMNVYATRRTAGYEQFVYDATKKNALNGQLVSQGEGVEGAITGFPFPIPKVGQEVIWNHKLAYLGKGVSHWNEQAAVTPEGNFTLVKLKEDIYFHYSQQGIKPEDLHNVGIYFLQVITQPPRLAGLITLVHETMDQVKETRRAWQYNPGQRRLRRAPQVGYDNPGNGSDGLRTNDQYGMFNGATDRYTWKLIGKKEMYVPYNSYEVHSDKYKVRDILHKGHINPDLARYELHRCWVVEANLKPGLRHIYARRVFYQDEDSWHMVIVDNYDGHGELWRWQESHNIQSYDPPLNATVMDVMYDLQSRRYLAMQMSNEDPEAREMTFPISYFDPANVAKQAIK